MNQNPAYRGISHHLWILILFSNTFHIQYVHHEKYFYSRSVYFLTNYYN
jgi:hypothetical protein